MEGQQRQPRPRSLVVGDRRGRGRRVGPHLSHAEQRGASQRRGQWDPTPAGSPDEVTYIQGDPSPDELRLG